MIEVGDIIKVSGPLVVAKNIKKSKMYDVVRVGKQKLLGEIIELRGDKASIQVYEETAGLGVGDPVEATGEALSVELGPGLVMSFYDGIQRPIDEIAKQVGSYITRGISIPGLSREKVWKFKPTVSKGDKVAGGEIIGEVKETTLVLHKVMVPHGISGEIKDIKEGEFKVTDIIAVISTGEKDEEITMIQRWPVRSPRPYRDKLPPDEPLITGTRVIDTFFPVAKGGTACIPGPFGSGKTVVQHQLAKWSDADIIVYIGCGERGNEMTDVLMEFPELKDPKSQRPLMERTVLIANTSNMPVAAREASIYTGVTIGEYFRDMGYSVAILADSTSRWAEAMREISGRLEEMPGEEGYPAYLGTRIAEFYERSGKVKTLSKDESIGALTIIGAVSPPGGDLSDPVVQATLKVVKVFWALKDKLAYQRHFPAISWLDSYSLYYDSIEKFLVQNLGREWIKMRDDAMAILQEEDKLQEIVRLVGMDALKASDRMLMEIAKSIREDFLYQNAFHPVDSYCLMNKQKEIMSIITSYYELAVKALEQGIEIEDILSIKSREGIAKARLIADSEQEKFEELKKSINSELAELQKNLTKVGS